MGRQVSNQTNFTAGVIDELLGGRIDLAKYNNGLNKGFNVIIFQQGGAKGRPGLRFVAEVKDSTKKVALLPFSFSITQRYVLEFGHQYIRFYTNGGRLENPPGTPVEVATPYLESEIFQLKFTQSADVLFITHPNHPQKQLNRLSATSWTFTDFVADPPPTVELGHKPAADLTLSATSGTGITITASVAAFLPGDVDRQIIGEGGRASIVGFTSTTVVTADVLENFPDTSINSGDWTLLGSPAVVLRPNKDKQVNATVTISARDPAGVGSTLDGFRSVDVGKHVRLSNGVVLLTQFVSANSVKGIIKVALDNKDDVFPGNWTLEEPTWTVARGFPRTVGFHDQRLNFAGTNAEPDTIWGSKTGSFRNFLRGTKDADAFTYTLNSNEVNVIEWISSMKDLIIGSSGGEFRADGGIEKPITPSSIKAKSETAWGSESVMPIRVDRMTLHVMTGGQKVRAVRWDFDVDGYVADDLMLLATSIGSPGITQLAFEKFPIPIIWAVRSDGKLLSLTFDPSQEVAAWAIHDTEGSFESVCSQLSTDKKKTQTWCVVNRTINGSTKRYIEFFDQAEKVIDPHPLHLDSALSYNGTNNATTLTPGAVTGAGITFTAGAATFGAGDVGKQLVHIGGNGRATITAFTDNTHVVATITSDFASTSAIPAGSWGLAVKTVSGLTHLAAKTVGIVGDGAAYPDAVVTAGAVTLDGPHALKIDVGLKYIPEIETLRPATNAGDGRIVFFTKGYNKVYIMFQNTLGANVNGEQVQFRSSAEPMGVAPSIKSEICEITQIGYSTDARINVKQTQPLPFCILAIQGILDVGDQ